VQQAASYLTQAANPRAVLLANATTLTALLKEVDQPAPLDKGILKIND